MRRSALVRKQETRRPWRRKPEDKVTDEVAHRVLARDRGCVMRNVSACDGHIELDHVDNGGMGKRGPSTSDNLVSLCSSHHRFKTENARLVRPLLREYLSNVERVEGAQDDAA